jgi:hypothetical protein
MMGHAPSIPTVSNLLLEFGTLLFYLEARLLELHLPLPQLVESRGWWGLVLLPGPVVRAAWGSFHAVSVFDTPFGDSRHETLPRGLVAPSVGARIRDRLRFPCKEIMEGFRDVVRHPHELAIRGGRTKKRRGEAMCVPHRVAQAKRKPRRDAPGLDLRGEWFSPGELRRDVGER